jgi:hypothetical protein
MPVLSVIGQLRDAGGHSQRSFSCLHTPLTWGISKGEHSGSAGKGRRKGKIFPEVGERHHHMILSGLRALEGVCSVLLQLNIEDMAACSLAKN